MMASVGLPLGLEVDVKCFEKTLDISWVLVVASTITCSGFIFTLWKMYLFLTLHKVSNPTTKRMCLLWCLASFLTKLLSSQLMRIQKLTKYRDPWPGIEPNSQGIPSNKWYQPYLTRPKWRMMKAQRHYQESWLLLKAHAIFFYFCFNFKLNKIGVFPAALQIHYMYWTRFQ